MIRSRLMRRIVVLHLRAAACGAATLLTTRLSSAAPPDDASRRAEAVYLEARAAFDKGEFERACPLFEQYYDLEPIPAALFILAECEARWGKPARAIAHFESFLSRGGTVAAPTPVQEQRTRMAYEQIARLSLVVAKVIPSVASSVAASVSVKLDGLPINVPAARPIVIEPGEHVLEMTSEAGVREERRFVVGAGEVRRIELGAPAVSERPSPPPIPGPVPASRILTAPVIVAGGVGTLGLVVGSVFGLLALGTKSDINAHCSGLVCDAAGKESVDRGQSLAAIATVGFVVGAIGGAAAAVLYFTQPSNAPASASAIRVRIGPAGVGGSF